MSRWVPTRADGGASCIRNYDVSSWFHNVQVITWLSDTVCCMHFLEKCRNGQPIGTSEGAFVMEAPATIKVKLAPKRLLVLGFPVTLISRCFFETEKIHPNLITLRLELRLVRPYQGATETWERFKTVTCVFLEIDITKVFNRGLHPDLKVLQRSKLVEIWGALNDIQVPPQLNVCTSPATSRLKSVSWLIRRELQPIHSPIVMMTYPTKECVWYEVLVVCRHTLWHRQEQRHNRK